MNAIEVTNLSKTYPGDVEAVRGLDFKVAAGEVFGLLGPNGAGKSTTVGMLTTTIEPTAGSARLAGFDVAEQPLAARRVSSVVFQEPVVDRSLTGRRNLEIHARLWGVEPREAEAWIEELAGTFGLADLIDRPAGTYSGGQRRRLEIARALVSHPRVLFLDEPTVGLDPRIRAELLEVLAGLGGQLVEIRVEGSVNSALASLRDRGVAGEDAFAVGSRVTVPLHQHSSGEAIAVIHELGFAGAISAREPTLDDVYLRLTGDSLAAAA